MSISLRPERSSGGSAFRARLGAEGLLLVVALVATARASSAAAEISALPDQTSRIELSNRDINHLVCVGGDIDDVKFSEEKAIKVERSGSDAWVKFLVKETVDGGQTTREYVKQDSEFFVSCNGAIYPLYAHPADIPAQTITLARGASQRAAANAELLGPLVEEERAVSVSMAILQDRVPESFHQLAVNAAPIAVRLVPGANIVERRHVEVEGAGLSASEYLVEARQELRLDERMFLDPALGLNIFTVTLDRLVLRPGDTAHLIITRRGAAQ